MADRLEAAGIPYMVVGSLAGSFHGQPRTTADVDIVIDPSADALRAFVDSLPPDEYYVADTAVMEAFQRRSSFNIIEQATGWKADLLIRRDRPFSATEFERRTTAPLFGRDTAGDPSPTPTPIPSAPASPSEEPESRYLDPVVANPDGVLPAGGVVRVLVDGLRVRDHAMVDSGERMVLRRGDLLIVGPTFGYRAFGGSESDGYTWYHVGVLGTEELPEPGGRPLGFVETGAVAIGDGESAWLELVDPRCTDDEPTLQHLSSLTEWERLACYGDRQLTFGGVLGCGGCAA